WWCNSPGTAESRQKASDKFIPGIQVTSVLINEISNDHVKMDTRIVLDNPLLININTRKIHYQVFMDSVQVLENVYNEPLIIKSGDTSVVELPVVIDTEALDSIWKHYKANNVDSAEYTIHAVMDVEVPIAGDREITMKFSRRLPVLMIPDLEIIDLDLNLLQIRKKGVDLILRVHNPNSFNIHIMESEINFYIDDYFLLKGTPDPDILLPSEESEKIALHANIRESNLLKTGWELLLQKDAPFSFY